MAGLLDRPDDLDQYLQDLLYGTRTRGTSFNAGPVYGGYQETRPNLPASAAQPLPAEPSWTANIGVGGPIAGLLRGNLGAALAQQPDGGQVISPSAGLSYGPVSVTGGVNINRQGDQTTVNPRFGANLNLPVFGGDLNVGGSITPGLQKELAAQWLRRFGAGELGVRGSYVQPDQGVPDFRIGVGGRWRF
jgi:hypothetical protein